MTQAIISASILSADFAHLRDDIDAVVAAGVDQIHFDVMDHHYVPNLTVGALVCKSLRQAGVDVPIDVHLMVEHPQKYIKPFAKAGATLICFHPETVENVEATLSEIQNQGMQAGLAFNPGNHIDIPDSILQQLDLILLMSVNPGFGGQQFIESCLDTIRWTHNKLNEINGHAHLGVDGGIKTSNIGQIAKAGADFFVVGSGLFHANDYTTRVNELRKAINSAVNHTGYNGKHIP